MADITYTVNQDDPNSIQGFEQFSQADKNLVSSYIINSLFDSNKNTVELHILSLADDLIQTIPGYTNYKLLGDAQSAGREGASIVTIDPVEDCKLYGYETGGVKVLYHFLNDLYSKDKTSIEHYIDSISPDRTELRLVSLELSDQETVDYTTTIKERLVDQSYFSEFRLNFGNNDLLIGINIDTVDYNSDSKAVVVKLYEPLPTNYDIKSTLSIVETVSDSVAYEVDSITTLPPDTANTLRPANFNLEIIDEYVVPTQYFSYTDLFSYPVNNTNNQIYSLFNEKGVELSIDHSNYANFIHFSSAQERLMNFKYKLQLIESYSSSLAQINNSTSQSLGITGSVTYYEGLTQGVVSNFDHYERFLYYQSSSYAWPKTNTTSPYINAVSTSPTALTWYANQLTEATKFDASNYNALINTIPAFLRDDPDNDNYLIFVHMIGQHFDIIWQYTQAVTDKYDGDNRLDFGISKDLVGEALKNFGVKLYTSNNSIEDLFGSFIGQPYQSGSEVITNYITGSLTGSNTPIQPSSYDNYNKEIQKRIYHNLSHLVKTKGTERGLRALINCFGIPSDILKIKLYGGRNVDERPFYGDYEYYTSSLDKIRLDNTGSLVTGSTLSQYTSIYKRDPKYTDDLHAIEVGFSPTDNVDNYIVSYSLATSSLSSFNIDDYIGDPRSLTANTYGLLNTSGSVVYSLSDLTNRIMSSSTAYDVFDFVRLIKFFDNTIFKMVRDFIPARVTADTGIIIKPHILQRNKAKSPILSGSRTELSASIDTAFIQGSHGSIFDSGSGEWSTRYRDTIQTPDGLALSEFLHYQEQPKFNGELSGSGITITNGNLNANNPYLVTIDASYNFGTIRYVSSSTEVCVLQPLNQIQYITSSTQTFLPNQFFNIGTVASGEYEYSASDDTTTPVYSEVTPPFSFGTYSQYTDFYLVAQSLTATIPCSRSTTLRYGTCSLSITNNVSTYVRKYDAISDPITYPINTWFTSHPNQTGLEYTASFIAGGINYEQGITDPNEYPFTQDNGTSVTITIKDPNLGEICKTSYTTIVGSLGIGVEETPESGFFEFEYSEYRYGTGLPNISPEEPNICDNLEGVPITEFCSQKRQWNNVLGRTGNSGNRGIPGYFRNITNQNPEPFPTNAPPGGQSIKYRIFTLQGSPLGPNGVVPYYIPSTNGGIYTPYANQIYPPNIIAIRDWLQIEPIEVYNGISRYYNQEMVNYVTVNQQVGPYSAPITPLEQNSGAWPAIDYLNNPDTSVYKDSIETGIWPVTIYTAFKNSQDSTYSGTPDLEENTLVRAYIIQAINPDIDSNPQYDGVMEQVVVYGKKSDLTPVEGTGQNLTFTDNYIKVGHNYATEGTPVEQTVGTYPGIDIRNQPSVRLPQDTWIKVPIRSYQ